MGREAERWQVSGPGAPQRLTIGPRRCVMTAEMGWLLPLLLAAILLATWRLSRRPLLGKAWLLLRCLFPSWRFFEDVEPSGELAFRVSTGRSDYGPWQDVLPSLAPSGRSLLLNARGNLMLAYASLVEQLLSELDGTPEDMAPALVPYQLVQRLVELRARQLGLWREGGRYQFKIALGEAAEDDVFVSREHAL